MRGPRRTSTSGGLSNLLPGDALPGRRLDERGEEPGAPRDAPPHALRMPLYAHGKGPPRDFYRLDRPAPLALHRPGHDREPGSRAVERRIDVLAPRQHEAVEAVERDLRGILGARKQRHHLASGRLNRVQVILQLGGATPGDPDPRAIARTGSGLPTLRHGITLLDFRDQVKTA